MARAFKSHPGRYLNPFLTINSKKKIIEKFFNSPSTICLMKSLLFIIIVFSSIFFYSFSGSATDSVIYFDSFENWNNYYPVGWVSSVDVAIEQSNETKFSGNNGILISNILGTSDTYISKSSYINVTDSTSYRCLLHVYDTSVNYSLQLILSGFDNDFKFVKSWDSNISLNKQDWDLILVDFTTSSNVNHISITIDIPLVFNKIYDGFLAFDDVSLQLSPQNQSDNSDFNFFIASGVSIFIIVIILVGFYKQKRI